MPILFEVKIVVYSCQHFYSISINLEALAENIPLGGTESELTIN
jgi:hypothetical protein